VIKPASRYRLLAAFMLALLSVLTSSYALASLSHRTTSPFPDRAQHAAQHNAIGKQRNSHLISNPTPNLRVGARDVGKAAAVRRWVGASPHLGMPKELIDGEGNLAWAAAHGAYGAVIATDGPGEVEVEGGFVSGGPRVESPFRLLGQVHDEDAELAWTRFRCFDADTGTWISTDPLEIRGGSNAYALDGSPNLVIDPLGLMGNKHGEEGEIITEGKVFRGGSTSDANLTPRPDNDIEGTKRGLSTFDTVEKAAKPGDKFQEIDVSKLGPDLEAFRTPDGHVSIRPKNDQGNAKLKDWASTRGTDTQSPLTKQVADAIVATGRRPKK
jgi:RHS repeat-associated protein